MALLPRRFKRLKSVLNRRMSDLTIVLENVEKPHNISAILRTCDAIGILEAHAVSYSDKLPTFNSTAQGSQKWVDINTHKNISSALLEIKEKGFTLYGTNLSIESTDYRDCDFTVPSAFVLGAEKWGLTDEATKLVDKSLFIPMRGMVQSLNVSVAASTLLYEALRQREKEGITPNHGEGMSPSLYKKKIFEWAYPEVASWCQQEGRNYPELDSNGEILTDLPRSHKMRC